MATTSAFSLPPISELFKDPFQNPAEKAPLEEEQPGSRCEISFCDARLNAKGDRIYLHAGTKCTFAAPLNAETRAAALIQTKYYDKDGDTEYKEIEVQSPHIRDAIRNIVKPDYPSLNVTSGKMVIREFSHCMFFHHKELRQYGQSLEDETAARHINLALEFLYKDLGPTMQKFKESVEDPFESGDDKPRLDFDNLWMAFRPGDLVQKKVRNMDCIYRLASTRYATISRLWTYEGNQTNRNRLELRLLSLVCDGENLGYGYSSAYIDESECTQYTLLKDLPIIPLKYIPESEKAPIMRSVLARGKEFIRLSTGVHHCEYSGLAKKADNVEEFWDLSNGTERMIKGRVLIDSCQFSLEFPDDTPDVSVIKPRYNIEAGEYENIGEEDILLASHKVMGFSLNSKIWAHFKIELIRKVEYNTDAFGKLVLPTLQKNMIRGLVSAHEHEDRFFDDIIQGKGRGITILLHGTPGVGKTLTAESVAEYTKRPLYAITAADFADKVSKTEKNLVKILELASRWKAVLLIDEADVFLEQRSFANMERNAIVSIFLRTLEYYNGVLILTTNRVTTLDSAFKSRIHLGIKYHPLSVETRRSIWKTFIGNAEGSADCEPFSDSMLNGLAKHQLDGRMIKNAVRMAHALANDEGVKMGITHLTMAVEGMQMFEQDMAQAELEGGAERMTAETDSSHSRKRQRRE